MVEVNLPAFYLGVFEELEKAARCWKGYRPVPGKKPYSEDSCEPEEAVKKAEAPQLQTSVPGETPDQLLSRVRQNNIKFPKFMQNAQQHKWNVPGVPFANSMIQGFLKDNSQNPEAIKNKINNQSDDTLRKVINKNPDAFKGVQSQPVQNVPKIAFDLDSMPSNENILPTLKGQTKWRYVRTKGGLKLTDGNLVYGFGGFPDEYPSEDTRISRLADDNILNFENEALSKGTAQIHRASPDNIYMTLADGARNPTFMLQHEEGKNWRYSPSKKFMQKLKNLSSVAGPGADTVNIDPAALLDGAKDQVKISFEIDLTNPYQGGGLLDQAGAKDLLVNLKDKGLSFGKSMLEFPATHPVTSLAKGVAFEQGLGWAKDKVLPPKGPKTIEEKDSDFRHLARNEALSLLASMAYVAK